MEAPIFGERQHWASMAQLGLDKLDGRSSAGSAGGPVIARAVKWIPLRELQARDLHAPLPVLGAIRLGDSKKQRSPQDIPVVGALLDGI